MRNVSHYGIHKERGISWLVQDGRLSDNAIGLPPEELFHTEILVHPRILRRCPHVYDLHMAPPRSSELEQFSKFMLLEPMLLYLIPEVLQIGTLVLLRVDYNEMARVVRALELLEDLHPKVDPIKFPASYFDLQHRSIEAEASRTNLMPLIVGGFSRAHMRRLPQIGSSLAMSPRTTILVSPLSVIAMGPFVHMQPSLLHKPEFISFLESVDLPRIGAELLRTHMREK